MPRLRELRVALVWFGLLGLLAGVLWWQLTPLAQWTRTSDNGSMDEIQLARVIMVDGWFAVIAAVGGLASGIVLTAWRKADPLLTVVLLVLGSGLATGLMFFVGHTFGPGDVAEALARAEVGDTVPIRLTPKSPAVYLVWPITALVGALGVMWGLPHPTGEDSRSNQPTSG